MTANDPLFVPLQLGAFSLSHRVVMPPTQWGGTALPESAPDLAMVRFYEERATPGGLVIAETAYVCPGGHLQRGRPGLYSIAQVNRWRDVTDAVHQRGGIVLAQLGYAWDGSQAQADMDSVLEDYRSAAENASDAGFDGIELDASAGSLPGHLLRHRDAAATPLLDIVRTLCAAWDPARIGIGLSASDWPAAMEGWGRLGLAYLRLAGCPVGVPARPGGTAAEGPILLSGQFDAATAVRAIAAGDAVAIGFEDGFAIHPDLPARLRAGAPLASAGGSLQPAEDGPPYADAAGRAPAKGRAP